MKIRFTRKSPAFDLIKLLRKSLKKSPFLRMPWAEGSMPQLFGLLDNKEIPMKSVFLALTLSLYTLPLAQAGGESTVPEVGAHYPILIVEKDQNPQNILVVYTKLGRECQIELDEGEPQIGFYWLMNGKNYKRMNSILEGRARERMQLIAAEGTAKRDTFYLNAKDISEMDHDLKNPRLTVKSRLQNGKCFVEGFMQLGPSDGNVVIRLDRIYGEGASLLNPVPDSVTLKGVNAKTGVAVKRTYESH
jgi:hypothetical protein